MLKQTNKLFVLPLFVLPADVKTNKEIVCITNVCITIVCVAGRCLNKQRNCLYYHSLCRWQMYEKEHQSLHQLRTSGQRANDQFLSTQRQSLRLVRRLTSLLNSDQLQRLKNGKAPSKGC